MLCEQCHEREAVVHLTQIVNEQVTTVHLCERCAAEKGVEGGALPAKTPLGDFLAAIGKGQMGLPVGGLEQTPCPTCGATLQDFRQSGRLGCADCYRTFEPQMRDLLRRVHGSTHHVGERYARRGSEPVSMDHLQDELRDQLRLAVETENFELAAELRDRLRSTE
jgi:protein arginine kinase activator